jgi:hypothetical protein
VNADGCSRTPVNTIVAYRITSVYTGGKKGTEVVLNTYLWGAHVWPKNATDLIWGFFMRHPKKH